MAFPERVPDNDSSLDLESVPPRDNLIILPQPDIPVPKMKNTGLQGTLDWLEQEYKIIMADKETDPRVGKMLLRNTVNTYSVTIRNTFFRDHPDVEFLSRL